MKKIIKKIAIETAHWSSLSFFYGVYYNIAFEISVLFIKNIPAVSSIFVRRSFSGPDWIAGYSDIDLAIVIKPLPSAADVSILTRIHSALNVLRIIFPVVSGHVLCVNETDLDRWLSYGNIRRLEFSRWVKRYG
jgi:hypothetical protein